MIEEAIAAFLTRLMDLEVDMRPDGVEEEGVGCAMLSKRANAIVVRAADSVMKLAKALPALATEHLAELVDLAHAMHSKRESAPEAARADLATMVPLVER